MNVNNQLIIDPMIISKGHNHPSPWVRFNYADNYMGDYIDNYKDDYIDNYRDDYRIIWIRSSSII